MSNKIDDYVIRRVKEAAKIQEVVSECGVKLVKKGQRYAGICPFHGDQAMGNFFVYPRMNVFKCFRCETKGDSVKFVMEHEGLSFPDAIRWLGKMYNIETDGKELNYTPPPRPTPPPPKLLLTLPLRLVTAREHTESDAFCYWVRNGIRWDTAQRQRVESVLQAYHVGHTSVRHYDFTMFWQIDEQDQVRTAHMMRYQPNGHHVKDGYSQDWFHSLLSRKKSDSDPDPYPQYYNTQTHEHEQTLFGMHLLNDYRDAEVCIVESEKTALLMAIAYGNTSSQVWMACAGKSNITRERLAPIIRQKRRVTLYPDRDGISEWQQQAERLHYNRVMVNTEAITNWWRESDGGKADIADIVVRCINETKTIEDVKRQMPNTAGLIDKLDLEIIT